MAKKIDPSIQALQTENTSTVYSIKRGLLTRFQDFNRNLTVNMHHKGYRRFMNKLMDKEIPKAYKQAAKAPVDEKKVVFVEVRHPHVTNSMQVMFDELANNYDYNIHTHFLLTNGTIRADFRKRCLDAVKDIATAKYVFMNEASNTMSAMPLRPETKIIQLWHGCGAFKKFGFSTADLLFGASRKEQLKHPFNKNYSLVTVSSPEVIWAYNEAMNIDESTGIVQATGSSRTDIFYDEEFLNEAREHVYELVPQAKGKKIILYAPTFRGRVAKAETPD
ncbi:CDP-glycerol glycerophosphotransferase family protein, partial [uncultured Eubacterium sp.]|uniref:CDP-glycerol glycerophosphotransferase family protein n=1 Tax=uncultured Eubacterium sp. TaxID=165185 RepID=UPI0015BB208E